jgi:hypothetical protein
MTRRKRHPADDLDCRIMEAHKRGIPTGEIAIALRTPVKYVEMTITNIIRDDIAHDPTAKDYWNQ